VQEVHLVAVHALCAAIDARVAQREQVRTRLRGGRA
jgi:hypothetical protein